MLFPGMCYTWLPGWGRDSRRLGLQGMGKRQCLTLQPAIYCFGFPALTILHVKNWFQKEAPSSKLKRTPPANARHNHLHKGHMPQTPNPQHQLRHLNSSQPMCPIQSQTSQAPVKDQKPTKPPVMGQYPPLPSSIPGRQHLGSETDDPTPPLFLRPVAWPDSLLWSWACCGRAPAVP